MSHRYREFRELRLGLDNEAIFDRRSKAHNDEETRYYEAEQVPFTDSVLFPSISNPKRSQDRRFNREVRNYEQDLSRNIAKVEK